MEQNSIMPDKDVIPTYKALLPYLNAAKKQFEHICDNREGINCHSCPLQIEKSSDIGQFKFCLYWGLIDGIKTLKREIRSAEEEVKK